MRIEARKLNVRVRDKYLLEEVSFEAHKGEIVAILGANGAGKSTLLKTLCGEIRPDAGKVLFGGIPLNEWNTDSISKVRAILPQASKLNFPFKVEEVALLGRTPHIEFTESERDYKAAHNALEMADVGHLKKRSYGTLSGGERQRVQLARVLAQIWEYKTGETRYLLLDEPTSSLDLAHQHLALNAARRFASENTVVIVVLHDINLAAQYADRILILKNGRSIAFDSPKKVLNERVIREAFGIEVLISEHPKIKGLPLVVSLGKEEIEEAYSASA